MAASPACGRWCAETTSRLPYNTASNPSNCGGPRYSPRCWPALACAARKASERVQPSKAAALRKPIENKIKRQEEQIAKRNAQKAETEAKLGEPTIYDAANKAKLKQLLADQTFFTKDLAQLEAEWLDLQDQLEKLG